MRPAFLYGVVSLIAVFVVPSISLGASRGAGSNSSIVDVVPALSEQFDTMLLFAGKPDDLWTRASSLNGSLAPVGGLDPLSDNGKWMKSLAAVAMMERAVNRSKSPKAKWVQELLGEYSLLANAEAKYRQIGCVVSAIELQRGAASAPLVEFGKSLSTLSEYCFDRMKRLASKELGHGADGKYGKTLLEYLCQAQEGLGDWAGLLKASKKLNAIDSTQKSLSWMAVALYELGKGVRAEKYLKAASAKNHGTLPKLVVLHRDIFQARHLIAEKNKSKNNGKLALALRALEDPEAILRTWTPTAALRLKSPLLDEIYTQALLDDGFRYTDAWKFAYKADAIPRTDGFLGFRIGAGMAVLLHGLLAPAGSHRLDGGIRKTIEGDLQQLTAKNKTLAKKTGFILRLMEVMAGKNAHGVAKSLAAPVMEYMQKNKQDLQALTLAFVIRRFGAGSIDTWKLMEQYLKRSANKLTKSGVSLLCLSAIEKALGTNSTAPLEKVSVWIETQADMDSRMDLKLWRANITAARGLLLKGPAQSKQLQRAVDAYGSVLAAAASARDSGIDSQKLCDVGTSLATLMMQGGSLEQARGLMGQLEPLCKEYPSSSAVAAVMNLAAGDEGKMKDSIHTLNKVAEVLPSQQARLQANLWLAVVEKASKKEKKSKEHFSKAAQIFKESGSGANHLILAPDLRSMVALSSNMELSAGYEKDNPLRLGIDMGLGVGFVLFPPAAVDESKLAEFSK